MRPLAELDAKLARGVRGVVFDIDDTVTREGRLELAAFQAMHRLDEAGVHLVAVTGRPLGWMEVIVRHWPLALGVAENGAGWIWRNAAGRWREGYQDPPRVRKGYGTLFERVCWRVAERLPDVTVAADQNARRCDLAFDIGETARLEPEEVDELVETIESAGAVSRVSTVHAHAQPGTWDKADGVRRGLSEALGLPVQSEEAVAAWVFVGDSANDAAAFESFPLSVGVANVRDALDRLPVPPAYVTEADRGAGFAEVADALLSGR